MPHLKEGTGVCYEKVNLTQSVVLKKKIVGIVRRK